MERQRYVTHLECGLSGEIASADRLQTVSSAGKPWLVRYDLTALAQALPRALLAGRAWDLWRYRELLPLPLDQAPISLDEACTPLLAAPRRQGEMQAPAMAATSSTTACAIH